MLDVSAEADLFDEVALRDAIGRELDCDVVVDRSLTHSGEIAVKRLASGQVSVAFSPPDRLAPLRRVVTLPRKAENRVQLIAWIVGNMARNEAAEWLAEHQREKTLKGAEPSQSFGTTEPSSENPKDVTPAPPAEQVKQDGSAGNAANKNESEKPPKLEVAQPTAPAQVSPTTPSVLDESSLHRHSINLALWHGLLELHPDAAQSRFAVHLGLGYGRVGAIHGFAFDAIHHRDDFGLHGFAGSLIWTRASQTDGVALSFGVVTAEGDLHGADLAQFLTYRDGTVNGLQLAGLATISKGDVMGGQGATLFNTSRDLRGLQLAWGANVANDVAGVQASFVNVGGNVGGVQFGLVNVAKRVDGIQIGLINIAENVRTQALLWAERNYLENVGVRYVYSPLLFAISTGYDSANDRLRFLFGFGARFAYSRFAFAPSVDVGAVVDKVRTHAVGQGHDNDVRASFECELVPRVLSIVGGPTLAFRSEGNTPLRPLLRWFAGVALH